MAGSQRQTELYDIEPDLAADMLQIIISDAGYETFDFAKEI